MNVTDELTVSDPSDQPHLEFFTFQGDRFELRHIVESYLFTEDLTIGLVELHFRDVEGSQPFDLGSAQFSLKTLSVDEYKNITATGSFEISPNGHRQMRQWLEDNNVTLLYDVVLKFRLAHSPTDQFDYPALHRFTGVMMEFDPRGYQ